MDSIKMVFRLVYVRVFFLFDELFDSIIQTLICSKMAMCISKVRYSQARPDQTSECRMEFSMTGVRVWDGEGECIRAQHQFKHYRWPF